MPSYAETVTRTARRVRIGNINGTNTVPLMEELGNQVLAAATTAGIDHRTAAREWVGEINAPAPDDQQRADAERTAATGRELVKAVRDHAQAHYDEGWDVIVEAYEDSEIVEAYGDATNPEQAIARMAEIVELRNDYRQDHTPIAGWHY